MPLILSASLKDRQFTSPDLDSKVTDAFIAAAEDKYLIPVLTKPLYDDIIANPATYNVLTEKYIAPCLIDFTRLLLYNQYLSDNSTLSVSDQLRRDTLHDLSSSAYFKLKLLADHLKTGIYHLYIAPVASKRKISGFLINQSNILPL